MPAGRKPTVSDDEILSVFEKSLDPVLTTKEVSESINLGRKGTYDRLAHLEQDGRLEKKKVGEKAAVWWIGNQNK